MKDRIEIDGITYFKEFGIHDLKSNVVALKMENDRLKERIKLFTVSKFQIGDKVRYIGKNLLCRGIRGTIVEIYSTDVIVDMNMRRQYETSNL